MKKILFFATLLAVCCAFAAVSLKKSVSKAAAEKEEIFTTLPVFEDFHEQRWAQNDTFIAQEVLKGKATFARLLEQFPKGALPFSLTTSVLRTDVDTMAYRKYQNRQRTILPREFRHFFPNLESESKFSRMPPPPPEPFLAFEADGKHVLIYVAEQFGKEYMVATFDAKGKCMSERPFARVSLNDMTAATLDEHLNLTCMSYKIVWDKESNRNGYKNGKITEVTLTKTTVESLVKKNSQKEIKEEKTIERAMP